MGYGNANGSGLLAAVENRLTQVRCEHPLKVTQSILELLLQRHLLVALFCYLLLVQVAYRLLPTGIALGATVRALILLILGCPCFTPALPISGFLASTIIVGGSLVSIRVTPIFLNLLFA